MKACTYLNITACAVFFGLSSFAACGGSQSPATSPASTEPVASAATTDPGASVAASLPAAPPASSASLAAAPTSPPSPPTSDRSMKDFTAIVAGNRDAFRACYDRSLRTHPGIKGTFVLSFVVNPDGSVKSAEADPTKSEIHTPDLESCAVGVLRGLKFPPSKKGM